MALCTLTRTKSHITTHLTSLLLSCWGSEGKSWRTKWGGKYCCSQYANKCHGIHKWVLKYLMQSRFTHQLLTRKNLTSNWDLNPNYRVFEKRWREDKKNYVLLLYENVGMIQTDALCRREKENCQIVHGNYLRESGMGNVAFQVSHPDKIGAQKK